MTAPEITAEDFAKFREFFYRKTGIYFDDSKRYFVDKRLIERIHATGAGDFRRYFNLIRFQASGEELQNLINLMTVNETYFFREEYQFKCLVRSILPEITRRKKPGHPIRIWSIPSATGEEPYSIAIYLLENWPLLDQWDVEILSSDIDTDALAKAREGIYAYRSLQYLPASLLQKYFTPLPSGHYQISPMLRDVVQFSQVNLIDPVQTGYYRRLDVIFCRNLLIYFDDRSRAQAAQNLYDALNPGGYLCLGHSESMSRITSLFEIVKFPEAIIYRKPE
ncbi:MAG: protein-glutamate O-methyltransferase CheR [Hydrogenophilus sp.]|nr:protein-glutamate O-methyltransferase CheR [Hydrogenophilus sp.]